jgi:hypothetical protein
MTPLAVILLLATAVSAIRGPGGATLAANSHFRRGRLSRRYVQCEVQTTTTASATTAYTTSTPDTTPTKSLLSLSGPCGDANADANNPNGQSWWLNCGLDNSGWNPPKITLDELVYVDLSSLDLGNSIYAPCRDYVGYFNTYGAMHNLPPIMIAAIAMQESTCNPYAVGGGSEQGMMQLTGSNCDGAPGGK